jgi:Spy/CpxP family protein refolding chaperone
MRGLNAPRFGTVVLILSLALNVCIAGGYFYSQIAAGGRPSAVSAQQPQGGLERKLEALVVQLGINPETSTPFKEMRRSIRTAQQAMAGGNRPLGTQYWEELATPQPDQQQLAELIGQMGDNRKTFQVELTAALVRFMATLTPDQRATLVKIVEDKGNPLGAPARRNGGS